MGNNAEAEIEAYDRGWDDAVSAAKKADAIAEAARHLRITTFADEDLIYIKGPSGFVSQYGYIDGFYSTLVMIKGKLYRYQAELRWKSEQRGHWPHKPTRGFHVDPENPCDDKGNCRLVNRHLAAALGGWVQLQALGKTLYIAYSNKRAG